METRNLHQKLIFEGIYPEDFFEIWMDETIHARFTKSETFIGPNPGDRFSSYDGYIEGQNIEIAPNKIVQYWKANEEEWPHDHYSIITLNISEVIEGTMIDFTQEGLPAKLYKEFERGWAEHYWNPIKKLIEEGI